MRSKLPVWNLFGDCAEVEVSYLLFFSVHSVILSRNLNELCDPCFKLRIHFSQRPPHRSHERVALYLQPMNQPNIVDSVVASQLT